MRRSDTSENLWIAMKINGSTVMVRSLKVRNGYEKCVALKLIIAYGTSSFFAHQTSTSQAHNVVSLVFL